MSSSNRKSANTPNNSNTRSKRNTPQGNTSTRSSEDEDSQSENPNTGNPSSSGIAATRFGGNPSSSRPTGLAPGEQGTAVGPLRLAEEDMQVTGLHGRRIGMDPGKHTPYFPGKHFQWLDNMHLANEEKPKLGVVRKDLITLKLIDKEGVAHEAVYPSRESMDFNDPKWLKALHKWRAQFINRKLNNNNDGQSRSVFKRPHWTQQEKDFLKYILVTWINQKRKPLSDDDWKAIATLYNNRFAGKIAKMGEATPPGLKNGGGMSQGSTLKKPHEILARPHTAVQSQVGRWPDVKEAMNAALRMFGNQPSAGGGGNNEQQVEQHDPYATDSESDNDEVPPDFNAAS